MKELIDSLKSRHRWTILAVIAAVMLLFAYTALGMTDYVESFVGVLAKMSGGGYFAFLICRYFDRVDLSKVEDIAIRAEVAKSRAMIIAACMLGAALGA